MRNCEPAGCSAGHLTVACAYQFAKQITGELFSDKIRLRTNTVKFVMEDSGKTEDNAKEQLTPAQARKDHHSLLMSLAMNNPHKPKK